MNRTSFRRALVPTVAALALALTACGSDDSGDDTGSESGGNLSGKLAGAGATSQEKAQEAWRAGFQTENPDVTITYDAIGSGDGRKNFIEKGVSFAGTDSYLKDDEGELTAAKERCGGEDPIEVPAYVAPIAVAFNLGGDITSLNLSAPVIADIFSGKVKKWNDPKIAAENDGVELPDSDITPVHRSDDSGTTKNFTEYLNKVAPKEWPDEADDPWPLKGGEAADGTSGVIETIKGTEGTIGYADFSQTTGLGLVSVKVGEEYVAPSSEAAASAVSGSPRVEGRPAVDMAIDINRTTEEAGHYPVLLASYLLACQHYDDAAEAGLVKGFLTYVLSEAGQEAAATNAGSAPLDATLRDEASAIVDKIAAK